MHAAVDETPRRHHVYSERDHQQASRAHVRRLKVPVARPKAPADGPSGWHRQEEQRQQRDDSRVFVAGRGLLQMLNDPMIGRKEYSDMENRSRKHQPAKELVIVQRKDADGSAPRTDR